METAAGREAVEVEFTTRGGWLHEEGFYFRGSQKDSVI